MNIRKRAMEKMRQYRTCPPPALIRDPVHADAVSRHREICTQCALSAPIKPEPLKGDDEAYRLFRKFQTAAFPRLPDAAVSPPLPGRIHRLNAGGWDGPLYRNPPLVLLLSGPNENFPFIMTAALIWHDPALAGPGDLVIRDISAGPPGEYITGIGGEADRTFSAAIGDLGPPVAVISEKSLDAARQMAGDPAFQPEWADAFPLIRPPDDFRLRFREMEAETARYFSAAASFQRRLSRISPGLIRSGGFSDFMGTPDGAARVLALARHADEMEAEAAAGEEGNPVRVNHIVMRDGKISRISMPEVAAFRRVSQDAGVSFTGQVDMPPGAAILAAYISTHDGELRRARKYSWNPESARFFLFFPVEDNFSFLHLAVITEE